MKKSEIYLRAQVAVLTAGDWIGSEYSKLAILRELMVQEDIYKRFEDKNNTNEVKGEKHDA